MTKDEVLEWIGEGKNLFEKILRWVTYSYYGSYIFSKIKKEQVSETN